jgi:hypothetical protein
MDPDTTELLPGHFCGHCIIAIYAPMIFAAPYGMFLMLADPL